MSEDDAYSVIINGIAVSRQAKSNLRLVLIQLRADGFTVRKIDSQPSKTKRGKRLFLATTKGKRLAVNRMITLLACNQNSYRGSSKRLLLKQ